MTALQVEQVHTKPTVKTLSFIIKQLTTKDYFLIPSDLNSIFKELDKVCTEFHDT